jgi:hypothetical protein
MWSIDVYHSWTSIKSIWTQYKLRVPSTKYLFALQYPERGGWTSTCPIQIQIFKCIATFAFYSALLLSFTIPPFSIWHH